MDGGTNLVVDFLNAQLAGDAIKFDGQVSHLLVKRCDVVILGEGRHSKETNYPYAY